MNIDHSDDVRGNDAGNRGNEETDNRVIEETDDQENEETTPATGSSGTALPADDAPKADTDVGTPPVDTPQRDGMPRKANGKVDYVKAGVDKGHKYVYEDSGLSKTDADAFVNQRVKSSEKAVEDWKRKRPVPEEDEELEDYRRRAADWKSRMDELETEADYWKQVKELASRREALGTSEEAAKAESQTETDVEEPKPVGKNRFGNIYDQFKGKVKEAVAFLMRKKGGDARAVFHREEVGDIDIVWGNGKAGLYHIILKHVIDYDDFNSVEEAIEVISDVLKNGAYKVQQDGRAAYVKGNYRVAIEKSEDGNWVVTAIDTSRKKGDKKRSEQDATILHQSIFGVENGTHVSQQPASDSKDSTLGGDVQEKSGEKTGFVKSERNKELEAKADELTNRQYGLEQEREKLLKERQRLEDSLKGTRGNKRKEIESAINDVDKRIRELEREIDGLDEERADSTDEWWDLNRDEMRDYFSKLSTEELKRIVEEKEKSARNDDELYDDEEWEVITSILEGRETEAIEGESQPSSAASEETETPPMESEGTALPTEGTAAERTGEQRQSLGKGGAGIYGSEVAEG